MASIRRLKRELNDVLGEIISIVLTWEMENPDANKTESQKIIDDSITVFDELIIRINQRKIADAKPHFKSVRAEMEKRGRALIERVNAL